MPSGDIAVSLRTFDGLHLAGILVTPDVAYERAAVMVHGGGVTREEGGFFTRLAAGLAAVALDRRADTGARVIHLLGTSFGGGLTAYHAAKRPAELTRLDVTPEDLVQLVVGIALATARVADVDQPDRLLALALAGVRVDAVADRS
ncbi:hypothetical protein [Candidatus Frankia nodulisporulans]|uniref:hypothetical protein n=1 Tax=Candidatus Frankia nodulisporulans TaxID=2060052 RepID=UPI0013D60FC3|nr:hypothetical protein [Candidatus Frankia nodulisporulans]